MQASFAVLHRRFDGTDFPYQLKAHRVGCSIEDASEVDIAFPGGSVGMIWLDHEFLDNFENQFGTTIDSKASGYLQQHLSPLLKFQNRYVLLSRDQDIGSGLSISTIIQTHICVNFPVMVLAVLKDRLAGDTWIAAAARVVARWTIPLPELPSIGLRPTASMVVSGLVAAKIPGIGKTKAEALLKKFRSLAGLCAASEEEIASVAKISPECAHCVYRTLHETPED
eukprot:Rmarinus@m.11498